MKALKIAGLLIAALVCVWASYLVYPNAYHQAMANFLAFVRNETTRQWSALSLLITALVLIGNAVWTIRTPTPPRPARSTNND